PDDLLRQGGVGQRPRRLELCHGLEEEHPAFGADFLDLQDVDVSRLGTQIPQGRRGGLDVSRGRPRPRGQQAGDRHRPQEEDGYFLHRWPPSGFSERDTSNSSAASSEPSSSRPRTWSPSASLAPPGPTLQNTSRVLAVVLTSS